MNLWKKYTFLLLLGIFTSVGSVSSQEISFSQFYANALYLNPAFAGARICPSLFLTFLSRYPGLNNSGYVVGASYDAYMRKIRGGFGIKLYHENQGSVFTNTTAGLLYSYRVEFSDNFFMNAGAEIIYYNRSFNPSGLVFADQVDPITNEIFKATQEKFAFRSLNFADVSLGLLANHDRFYAGFSVKNILRPQNSFLNADTRLPMRINGLLGVRFILKSPITYLSDFEILPNILYQRYEGINQINAGLYLTKLPIVAGIWYKVNSAYVLLFGFQLSKYSIGYSYDILSTEFAENSYGSHEITFRLNLECFDQKRNINSVKCPVF